MAETDDLADQVFRHIEHGDEKHRQWLRDELHKFFLSRPSAQTTDEEVENETGLVPCPFCGGNAGRVDIAEPGDNFGGSCICCNVCGASSSVHFDRKENLADSWNKRSRPSAQEREAIIEECAKVVEEASIDGWLIDVQIRKVLAKAIRALKPATPYR